MQIVLVVLKTTNIHCLMNPVIKLQVRPNVLGKKYSQSSLRIQEMKQVIVPALEELRPSFIQGTYIE